MRPLAHRILVLMSLSILAVPTAANAADIVRTGTGCLKLSTGTLSKIKVGQLPLLPCSAGEVIARLSSGDITEIATPVNGGLLGGTNNGAAAVSLQQSFRLPQSCAPGQMPRWNGSAWECATPPAGGGGGLAHLEDLIGLPCGTGGDAGTVALAINPLSRNVALACPRLGQFMLDVAIDGPGSVQSATPEITCGLGGGDCAHAFDAGDLVTLNAASAPDVTQFLGWSGACSGDDPVCQVPMNQARQVTATFLPTLTVHLGTIPSSRQTNCQFTFCVSFDVYTDSKARVTVSDLDTGLTAGACDADTTAVVQVTPNFPPAPHVTTCSIPVVPGHHLRLLSEDKTTLGGTQTFFQYLDGGCAGSSNPICDPAAAVSVHEEITASFN